MDQNNAGSAAGIDLAEMNEKLECVSRWIDKFPVPTTGATRMMMHLAEVGDALARATPQHPDPIGYVSKQTLEMLRGPDLAPDEHVRLWHAENPPSRATIPVYLSATPQHSVTEQAISCAYCGGDAGNCDAAFPHPRAQPLASTAATQPEQASDAMVDAYLAAQRAEVERHDKSMRTVDAREACRAGLRAALAIPASTAPALPQPSAQAVRDRALEDAAQAVTNSWSESASDAIRTIRSLKSKGPAA